jgi:hypothetical protein
MFNFIFYFILINIDIKTCNRSQPPIRQHVQHLEKWIKKAPRNACAGLE